MINAATLAMIVSGIQAGIAAAPSVIAVAEKGKDFITELFKAGKISKETQDQVHAHVDAVQEAALAGQVPPSWLVEPDPS